MGSAEPGYVIEPDWHPEAILDAEVAKAWYLERSPEATSGFLRALDDAVAAVSEAPERWPKHRHGCRRFVFPNQYPYALIYRVSSDRDLQIVAVAHHGQRPGYWRKR